MAKFSQYFSHTRYPPYKLYKEYNFANVGKMIYFRENSIVIQFLA